MGMESIFLIGRRISFLVIIMVIAGSAAQRVFAADEPLNVYVVNYPLKYFAERIGGEHVNVSFPAPPDVDPAYWIPDIKTITDYQNADLILLNGASYAKWIAKVSLPRSRMINTSRKFRDRYLTIEGSVTHSHGPGGEHAHGEIAFTTWLDLTLAAQQAEAIAEALSRKLPQHRDAFKNNFRALNKDLRALDAAIRKIVDQNPGLTLVASHPVYDYMSRAYGMNLKSLHWEPEEFPDDRQWMNLKDILKEHPSEWMLWEGTPDPAIVSALKSMAINSAVFDPAGNVPEQGDFLTVMQQNIQNLEKVYTSSN